MFLYEYEGKQLFREGGLPVPDGGVASSIDEAIKIANEIGYPVVVKPQIRGGKRGKAGAIRFAENDEELKKNIQDLFNLELHGEKVEKVLVEKKVSIKKEYYLAFLLDFYNRKPVAVFSTEGGIDIEEVAKTKPEAIVRKYIDPEIGVTTFVALEILNDAGIKGAHVKKFLKVITSLWNIFKSKDLFLAEINPLIETQEGEVIAVDARVITDDNAEYRHPKFVELKKKRHGTESLEYQAKEKGVSFVVLGGDIGVIGNGAGLTMATCDAIYEFGGKPANFLDIGGGAGPERVAYALDVIRKLGDIKVILINIFGGITRADNVAKGIIEALGKIGRDIPLVVRLTGTNEDIGRKMLEEVGIKAYTNMNEAVKKAVEIAKGGA
ncbi:MAG: ADP-forming succinate--CoA ligase subunit beta [Candidatus Njordarchaeia archaeon]